MGRGRGRGGGEEEDEDEEVGRGRGGARKNAAREFGVAQGSGGVDGREVEWRSGVGEGRSGGDEERTRRSAAKREWCEIFTLFSISSPSPSPRQTDAVVQLIFPVFPSFFSFFLLTSSFSPSSPLPFLFPTFFAFSFLPLPLLFDCGYVHRYRDDVTR